jgi:hypothetical protein
MANVAIVAALMGTDKTRVDMLPYLQSKFIYFQLKINYDFK